MEKKGGRFDDPDEEEVKPEELVKSLHLHSSYERPKMNPNAKPFDFTPSVAIEPKVVSFPPTISPSVSSFSRPPCVCIMCPKEGKDQRETLEHMLKDHSLVIGDIEKIADFAKYCKYWHEKV